MRRLNASNAKRIAAGIIGWMMLVAVLFSAFFIAAEAHHDCTGEDCHICACIRQCENTLRGIGDGTAAHISVLLPILFILLITGFFAADFPLETPVSRKVRLNN